MTTLTRQQIDPRGIRRQVVSAESKADGNYVSLDCGHTAIHAPHFMPPRKGSQCFCFECGQIARRQTQECAR